MQNILGMCHKGVKSTNAKTETSKLFWLYQCDLVNWIFFFGHKKQRQTKPEVPNTCYHVFCMESDHNTLIGVALYTLLNFLSEKSTKIFYSSKSNFIFINSAGLCVVQKEPRHIHLK